MLLRDEAKAAEIKQKTTYRPALSAGNAETSAEEGGVWTGLLQRSLHFCTHTFIYSRVNMTEHPLFFLC